MRPWGYLPSQAISQIDRVVWDGESSELRTSRLNAPVTTGMMRKRSYPCARDVVQARVSLLEAIAYGLLYAGHLLVDHWCSRSVTHAEVARCRSFASCCKRQRCCGASSSYIYVHFRYISKSPSARFKLFNFRDAACADTAGHVVISGLSQTVCNP